MPSLTSSFSFSTYLYIAVKVSKNPVGSVKQKAFKQRPQVNMGFQWWRQCYQYTDKEGVGVWGTWSSGDSTYVLEKTCKRGRLTKVMWNLNILNFEPIGQTIGIVCRYDLFDLLWNPRRMIHSVKRLFRNHQRRAKKWKKEYESAGF